MVAPVLIIAIGNESRGDDALAPLLLRRLPARDDVELLEDFQLQIEHAADIVGRGLVLFIDAGIDTPAPYSFYRISPDDGRTLFSHALAPEAVLSTYTQVYGSEPPPSYILCLRGEQFELGSSLSPEGTQRLEQAQQFLQLLLQELNVTAWDARSMPRA